MCVLFFCRSEGEREFVVPDQFVCKLRQLCHFTVSIPSSNNGSGFGRGFWISPHDLLGRYLNLITLFLLLRSHDSGSSDTLVSLELSCRQPGLEHLTDLLECSVLDLGQEEVYEDGSGHAGREPDVAIARAPVQSAGVDEVWGCECG